MKNTKILPISVVIPAYNEEKNIGKTLDSLMKMAYKPSEVIVVNNASVDNTQKVAKSYKNKFKLKKIKYIVLNEKIKGVARARNKGFRLATNSVIASTDADTTVDKNWIKNINLHFKKNNSIAVTGKIIMENAPLLVKKITQLGWYGFLTKFLSLIFGFQTISTANSAIKKKWYLKIGGFDNSIISPHGIDDTEISSRLSKHGQIRYDNKILVYSSFRKYKNIKNALNTICKMSKAWIEISKKRKQNHFSSILFSYFNGPRFS